MYSGKMLSPSTGSCQANASGPAHDVPETLAEQANGRDTQLQLETILDLWLCRFEKGEISTWLCEICSSCCEKGQET